MVCIDINRSNTHADPLLGSRWAQMWVHMWAQTLVILLVYVTKGNTETSTEPSPVLLEEDNDIEVLQDKKEKIISESKEKKFITSTADIEVHQKIELQDANVSDEQ